MDTIKRKTEQEIDLDSTEDFYDSDEHDKRCLAKALPLPKPTSLTLQRMVFNFN